LDALSFLLNVESGITPPCGMPDLPPFFSSPNFWAENSWNDKTKSGDGRLFLTRTEDGGKESYYATRYSSPDGGDTIYAKDLFSLKSGMWVTDPVINAILSLICQKWNSIKCLTNLDQA
jgi:hypothetical protein